MILGIPGYRHSFDVSSSRQGNKPANYPCLTLGYDATLILAIVCSCLRNVRCTSTKLRAIELLLAAATFCQDHDKLDRVIPYLLQLTHDSRSLVRQRALVAVAQLVRCR
jgi:hypothetical protein